MSPSWPSLLRWQSRLPGVRPLVAAAVVVLAAELVVVTLQGFGKARQASLVSYPPKELTTEVGFAKTLESAVADTCGPESAGRINMVGADYPWLNHNYLSMLALEEHADEGLACYYTAIGYAERDPNVAWERVLEFKPPYYISIDYANPANLLPPDKQALIRPPTLSTLSMSPSTVAFVTPGCSKCYREAGGTGS